MRYWYMVIPEWRHSEEGERHRAYGIACIQENPNGVTEVARICDISCNERMVKRLAARCTRLQLRPVHLYDVVINALA